MIALTARADMDPQEEPLASESVEEKDWRDLTFNARRSITNAERCERHGDRRINLIAAARQIALAIERLQVERA